MITDAMYDLIYLTETSITILLKILIIILVAKLICIRTKIKELKNECNIPSIKRH